MEKNDDLYLRHILKATILIAEYLKDIDYETFLKSNLFQDAVIRELEIIGEASNKLSPVFQKSHPNIPWKDIIGMRHKLIHDYFGVDIDAVWETAKTDIPLLYSSLQRKGN